jgi:hypothetical protein
MLISEYGISEQRVRVIPDGMHANRYDIPETRDEARHILGCQRNPPIVLAIRRLTLRMGLSELASVNDVWRGINLLKQHRVRFNTLTRMR